MVLKSAFARVGLAGGCCWLKTWTGAGNVNGTKPAKVGNVNKNRSWERKEKRKRLKLKT